MSECSNRYLWYWVTTAFRKPPLNLKMFISGDTFYNSTFFYEQLEFTWLRIFVAVKLRGEIDAPGRDPIPLAIDIITKADRPNRALHQICRAATQVTKPQRFIFIRFFPAFGFTAAPRCAAASACLVHCARSSASS